MDGSTNSVSGDAIGTPAALPQELTKRLAPYKGHGAKRLRRDVSETHRTQGALLIATLRLFGLWALLLTGVQVAPVATAMGDEADVIDLLSAGRIRTAATWCYKKPGPERCGVTLHIKDGSVVLEGVGCGSFRVPINGSNGRQAAKITGNTITVTVAGSNGTGVNTYDLSTDMSQCSYRVECPDGFQAKVFSCSVDRNTAPHTIPLAKSVSKTGEQSPLLPAPSRARVDGQSYMDAARVLKEQDPDYNSFLAAALVFRTAAAAFQAAGDNARAQAATDEAQTLEDNIKIASEKAGLRQNQNDCSVLRGNAFQCYIRATRLRPESLSLSSPRGAFLDCVKTYCGAMQSANCPMPVFGKDNAGFCFTAAIDDPDFAGQKSLTCAPGKHLVSVPSAREPICRDDANGSTKSQPESRGTKAGR
jgi:hypothetical protein